MDSPLFRRRLVIFLGLWVVMTLAFVLDGSLDGNELDTLALAEERIDPTFLPHDFRLSLAPGSRLPFQLLLVPLLRAMPLAGVSIVGRLLLYALLAGGLARLAARVGLDVFEALIAGTLFVWMKQGLAAGEFVIGGLEGKVLAYACVFWGLDAFLGAHWVALGVWFGLAFTVHPLVGGWSTLALAATAWTLRAKPPGREAATGTVALVLSACPGLAAMSSTLASRAPAGVDAAWIYVYFRHPHHLDPRWFLLGDAAQLAWFAAATLLALAALRIRWRSHEERALARFAQVTLGIFWLGIAVACLPSPARFLRLYPFRLGDSLFPLFAIALGVGGVGVYAPARWVRWGKVLGAGAAVVLAITALVRQVQAAQQRRRDPTRRAYAWISEHTEREALVLCSPGLDYAGLHMRRATVACGRAVPTADADVAEWYRRLVALDGGKPPRERGFPAFAELDRGFEALSVEQYRALATEYGARYLLRKHGRDLPFPADYDDGAWVVYRLR